MAGELGKASLDLTADVTPFLRGMKEGERASGEMRGSLDALAAVAEIAEEALGKVRMKPGQGAESATSAEGILRGVRGIRDEALEAARELDRVRLTERQAAESDIAGDVIDRKLKDITGNANEARRAVESVRIAGGIPGRSGVGVGPFGSGFGRIGALGAAIGAGTLLAPAAGPGALGLLAGIPTLAAGGAGALGTLLLAFQGVGKAIGGDKKAFDELTASQQAFVLKVRSLDGFTDKLKQTAGASLFPGLTGGLTAALSPGTLGEVVKAVQEFGKAIGQAGLQWGRYFGSAQFQRIFGPLMAAGAHNFLVLSGAALKLFDALGVLGRAAIPFTNWLTQSAAQGARWLDTFTRAKDASGGLAHALNQAQTSLRLVAKFAEALLRAVYALGQALYPVSKVAVKDLTNGLNALAGVINRNRTGIRNLVGGALNVLVGVIRDLSNLVRALSPLLKKVFDGVNALIKPFGGWKTVLEGIIALRFASVISGWVKAFSVLIGAEGAGGLLGAAGAASKLRLALLGLGSPAVLLALGGLAKVLYDTFEGTQTAADTFEKGNPYPKGSGAYFAYQAGRAGVKPGADGQVDIGGGQTVSPDYGPYRAGLAVRGAKKSGPWVDFSGLKKAAAAASQAPPYTVSPFGAEPPFTKNVPAAKKPAKRKSLPEIVSGSTQLGGRLTTLAAILAASDMSGETQLPTGINLLPLADRLALDKAKITPDKSDDLKALLKSRSDLMALAKVAGESLKLPLADEIGKLSTSINRLTGAVDKNTGALNEQQFLSSFRDIVSAYAPNAFPEGSDLVTAAKRTNTHGYETVNELRKIHRRLAGLGFDAFPASRYADASAVAAAG